MWNGSGYAEQFEGGVLRGHGRVERAGVERVRTRRGGGFDCRCRARHVGRGAARRHGRGCEPPLIEKVLTAVTDGQGRYQIVDLRPGVYTVTFSLPGFGSVRREGLELTVGFTATVNADLPVGALEETLTVTGAAPLVDTRNTLQQTTLSAATLDALPTTRRLGSYATMIPAARGASQDVGGISGERGAAFAVHGGRTNEINVNQEGLNLTMLNSSVYSFNPFSVGEVAVELAGTSAETFSGGVRVNIVPKEGGNVFAGNFGFSYSNPDLQSDNLSDSLRRRGVTSTPSLRESYQWGGGAGGPIKEDTLWYFGSVRDWVASRYFAGNFFNRLHGVSPLPADPRRPTTLFYEPDASRPAYSNDYFKDASLRLTWQASAKDKIAAYWSVQDNCNCPNSVVATASQEANGDHHYNPSTAITASWSRPMTARLLFEGGTSLNKTTINSKRPEPTKITDFAITDQALGITYGARAGSITPGNIGNPCCYSTQSVNDQYNWRFATSYITGSHAFKTGFTYQWYTFRNKNQRAIDQIHGARSYAFRDRVPLSVTVYATPLGRASDSTTVGAFVQDQWTIRKLTLNMGLRYDSFNATAVAQSFAAGYFVPARDFPEVTNVPDWKNLNPRLGVAYDIFGNGRTALKASVGRYVLGTSSTGNNNVALNQPILQQANSATRTWNDANGNYIPDCELGPAIPGANGECGALSDQNFGQVLTGLRGTRYADEILNGFQDAQEFLWRGSIAIEHELRPGLGVNVGYFRTSYGNQQVTRNQAVDPSQYDEYCITAPTDSRLPSGISGSRICGLYDIRPAVFGRVENVITQADNFGEPSQVFNGVDVNVRARMGQGVTLQGGVSTGRTVTDTCYVVNSGQDLYHCRVTPPWSAETQVKFLLVYPLPWDFRASAVYQNLPGLPVQASYVARNAEIAPSLGRNMGSCRGAAVCNATVTLNLGSAVEQSIRAGVVERAGNSCRATDSSWGPG